MEYKVKKIIKRILQILKQKYVTRKIKAEQLTEEFLNVKNCPKTERIALTNDEKKEVVKTWGFLSKNTSFEEYEYYKFYNGFNAKFVSHYFYLPLISHRLNNYHYTKFLEHKSLLGNILGKTIKFPKNVICTIDKEFYDGQMKQISLPEAVKLCLPYKSLIVKNSLENGGGRSLIKMNLTGNIKIDAVALEKEFSSRKVDFVAQELVEQHSSMARFNPTSINTFRITTLYLNGVFSVLSIILRFGKKDMHVDNWGSGGILVGVQNNGQLNEFGWDIKMNKFNEYNGIVFKDTVIEQIPDLLRRVEKAHKEEFQLSKLIGWDICIDKNNEPTAIEVNSSQPGIFGEQLCTGPIFGDRTQEVIDYLKQKPFLYNRFLMRY